MPLTDAEQALIKRVEKYVRLKLYHEPSGHDWFHVERVWKTAKFLQEKEGGDSLLIELAALLHNLKEHNAPLWLEEKSTLALHGMMDVLQIEEPLKSKILEIIEHSKFQSKDTTKPGSIEGRIIQDANWLDSLGAVGIARAFASGGSIGRSIYDPAIQVRPEIDKLSYQKDKKLGTSLNYLYEKSLKVAGLLNTESARKIAGERIKKITQFIEEFKKEWEGKDSFNK